MSNERETGEEASGRSEVSGRTQESNRVIAKQAEAELADRYGRSGGNVFVRFFRGVFGYRKTSLTLFVCVVLVVTVFVSGWERSLEYSVELPDTQFEQSILDGSWADLQEISRNEHTYASHSNDRVHEYLRKTISGLINRKYMEVDNDLNNTNTVYFKRPSSENTYLTYYESNNYVVRINGTNKGLPGLLLSAHYDSVPTSYGVTDDGMGVASLLGVLRYYASNEAKQPLRTIVLNFNNNEEFGLYGAKAFLSHPWASNLKFFLNLEGTGAGGKAVLFRATDYGIAKYFKNVRYPFASSILQQGFANRLVHSETDYHYYTEMGNLRGLDLAFYKPRDIYHTALDNIKNVNSKSLWHMLSNAIDFTTVVASQTLDLDNDHDEDSKNLEAAVYSSLFNWFFIVPSSTLLVFNIVLLTVLPLVSLVALVIVFNYKKNWRLSFFNIIKYPISLLISVFGVISIDSNIGNSLNEFLPNSNYLIFVTTYFSLFILLNYLVLNGLNLIFSSYKILNHDEKLIVMIETSFIYWLTLLWSTRYLSVSKREGYHSGEFALPILFSLQSLTSLFGIFSWLLKSKSKNSFSGKNEDEQPLLDESSGNYGSNDQDEDSDINDSVSSSSLSNHSFDFSNEGTKTSKTFSYDWSIQFFVLVPITSFVIYNSGILVLSCINKSIQESAISENFIYKTIQIVAIVWAMPFLPFVFKLNRIFFLALVVSIIYGSLTIALTSPFDESNPMKLRFVQSVDSNISKQNSHIQVFSRSNLPLEDVINEIPSYHSNNKELSCQELDDGMQQCSYKTNLTPYLASELASHENLVEVEVLRNTSLDVGYPFGLLMTELKVNAPNNRVCDLVFNVSDSTTGFGVFEGKSSSSPVTTVIVYADDVKNSDAVSSDDIDATSAIKEGFSRDENGNYIYKVLSGIDEVELNKLDWNKSLHLGIQWIPSLVDTDGSGYMRNKLGVSVQCYWSDLGTITDSTGSHPIIPAYDELLHYSPNYVSWANRFKGLVVSSTYIEL